MGIDRDRIKKKIQSWVGMGRTVGRMDMEGVGLGSKLALTKVHYIESQLMKILLIFEFLTFSLNLGSCTLGLGDSNTVSISPNSWKFALPI